MSFTASRSPSPSITSTRSKKTGLFPPLSQHGMPKMPLSPDGSLRPHRFSSDRRAPSSPQPQPPLTPMSPPMSAKSFGTFIDSEPSTPAYSPRMGSTWDGSTLVLLSPRSSAPSSPVQPSWEMMAPLQKPKRTSFRKKSASASLVKDISMTTSLSSHPVKPIREESQKENLPPPTEEETEPKAEEEQQTHTATLEKLANRVKSILRRRSAGDNKKSEERRRRRGYDDLDRIEDVHWTEM